MASPEHDAAELLAHVLGIERSRLPLVDVVPTPARRSATTRWSPAEPHANRSST